MLSKKGRKKNPASVNEGLISDSTGSILKVVSYNTL